MATTVYRPSTSSTGDVSITGDINASGTINTVGITSNANATAITIDSNENVGVGIATPDGRLHVHTASAGSVAAHANGNELILENSGNTGLSILSPDASFSLIYFGSPTDSTGAQILWQHSSALMTIGSSASNASLKITSGAGAEAIHIDSAQNVSLTGDILRIETQKTPASASATGTKGDIAHDTGFIYVCTATDTWKRVAIASW